MPALTPPRINRLVSGAGKKLWKQKGTGRAAYRLDPFATVAARRHGAWPATALLRLRLPRKKLLGALRSALASKFADGKLDRRERL